MTDTIFALATAPGRAAIAVLRISGPAAGAVLDAVAGRRPEPRRATVLRIRDAAGDVIDHALTLWFEGPNSFTGEDAAELHLHGGPAVVDAVTGALAAAGARLADPGEFTRRAFANGKLDLAQAEAVADLVDAETDGQRRQALAQLDGALSARHREWRDALIGILALLEAEIDFPEEDVPDAISLTAGPLMDDLVARLDAALAETARGERVRSGYRVAIIGAPNAGKSSLLNALLGRDAAIVTDIAGTTRDVIEAPLVLAGYKILLADTAGLRDTDEIVEREGVRRARAWAQTADLRVLVIDRADAAMDWQEAVADLCPYDLIVLNKADLPAGADTSQITQAVPGRLLDASVRGEPGVGDLIRAIEERVVADLSGGEFPAATRLRHQGLILEARDSLARARGALGLGAEIAAAEVHLASQALGRITGGVDNEAVLDRVFSSFCIGK